MLTQYDDGSFSFRYEDIWMADPDRSSISLTLPRSKQEYHAPHLFAFFYNMLPEGRNREVVCSMLRIDRDDYFSLLMVTARYDTVGAVTVKKQEKE